MAYYIGVDGGGTKTAYALFDSQKNIIAEVKTAGSNHENLDGSFKEAADIIFGGITALLEKASIKLSDVSGVLMGLAGVDHQFQHDALYGLLSEKGIKNPRIYNDGFLVIKAGAKGKSGIGYNCGTGTCCNSIDDDGKMLQLGGFGELSGDTGNGYWIAERTLAAIYSDVCLRAEKTALTESFCAAAGVEASEENILSFIAKFESEERESVCRMLTDAFFEAANGGDKLALEITEHMARAGARLIGAHLRLRRFGSEPVSVVLSGSMNVKMPNEIYLGLLKKYAEELGGRKIELTKLTAAPVTGCINWLLEGEE